MSLVVYPGTFDPLTLGHQDVVNRVAAHHESVVVAISDSRTNTLFTMAERVDMAKAILVHGTDPELRNLAQGIIAEQQNEINVMRAWLQRHDAGTTTHTDKEVHATH